MWALRFAQESQSGCAAPAGGGAIAHRGGPKTLTRNAVFIHLHPAIGEGVCPDGRGPYGQRLSAVAHRDGIGFGGNGAVAHLNLGLRRACKEARQQSAVDEGAFHGMASWDIK
ncbi:hypothetical protein [Stenotrophomonas muris]|uniref:hypothetical protein n=1 Tax=Stenotrophomonas muris TaxID=2963283 RepID=UPI0039C5B85A